MMAAAPTERPFRLLYLPNKSSALSSTAEAGGPRTVVIPNLPIRFPEVNNFIQDSFEIYIPISKGRRLQTTVNAIE